MQCQDENNKYYNIALKDIGFGLGHIEDTSIHIHCPFVENFAGTYGGGQIRLGSLAGSISPNLYVSLTKGVCTITSSGASEIFFGAMVGGFSIYDLSNSLSVGASCLARRLRDAEDDFYSPYVGCELTGANIASGKITFTSREISEYGCNNVCEKINRVGAPISDFSQLIEEYQSR